MSFVLPKEKINKKVRDQVVKSCTFKPKKDMYSPDPEPIYTFKVSNESILLPIGLWQKYYSQFPNKIDRVLSQTNYECRAKPLTPKTDPSGRGRDQPPIIAEAMAFLKKKRTVFISVPTGGGKTSISIIIAHSLGLKTLVIVHLDGIKKGWQKEFAKHTTAKVQFIKGKKGLDPTADVYIVGVEKCGNMQRADFEDIGVVIVDEAHMITASTFSDALFQIQPQYLIGLSATPTRLDGLHKLFTPFFNKDFVVREEKKIIHLKKYVTSYEPEISYDYAIRGELVSNSIKKKKSIELSEERQWEIINNICKKHSDNKILILSDLADQTVGLAQKAKEAGLTSDTYHSTKNLKKVDQSVQVLCVGIRKGGTGLDTDRDLLVIASAVNSTNLQQYEGRIRAYEFIVYHLVDNHFTYDRKFYSCKKWYDKRSGEGSTYEVVLGNNVSDVQANDNEFFMSNPN